MSQTEKKTKLSDVARQTNTEKAKRFSSTMIPAPPVTRESQPAVASTPSAEVSTEQNWKGEEETTDSAEAIKPVGNDPDPITIEKPAPAKAARSRRSGSLTIDDVVNGESPKGESYPRQVRVAESHHKLLRKLAFMHDKTINHLLYNLLEQLNQADQRDQQNHV